MNNYFAQRRDNLKNKLSSDNISAAIINDPVNIYYLTGKMLHPLERYVGLLIDFSQDKPILVLPLMEKDDKTEGIKEIGYQDTENPLAIIGELLDKKGKIGVEKKFISYDRMEQLSLCTGLAWGDYLDISEEIAYLRRFKDDLEIANHQKAADITCQILAKAKEKIAIGSHDRDILLFLSQEVWNHPQLQGVSFDTQVSSGLKTAKAHGVPGDHILEKGQQILIDFGVNFQYYKSDITRTFFASHPCSQLEEMYKVVLEAQLTAIEKAAPGIPISQIDLAARNVIAKAGYGEYFNHRTGHGLGLDIHETPNIYDINEDILQEGMVFTVEPGIYLPQMGGVRVEDDVLITASGHHIFTDFPKEFSQIILEK